MWGGRAISWITDPGIRQPQRRNFDRAVGGQGIPPRGSVASWSTGTLAVATLAVRVCHLIIVRRASPLDTMGQDTMVIVVSGRKPTASSQGGKLARLAVLGIVSGALAVSAHVGSNWSEQLLGRDGRGQLAPPSHPVDFCPSLLSALAGARLCIHCCIR